MFEHSLNEDARAKGPALSRAHGRRTSQKGLSRQTHRPWFETIIPRGSSNFLCTNGVIALVVVLSTCLPRRILKSDTAIRNS